MELPWKSRRSSGLGCDGYLVFGAWFSISRLPDYSITRSREGVPLPPGFTHFHPSSPNVTQGFRWVKPIFAPSPGSPASPGLACWGGTGVPGKPGFGLLGWKVTQEFLVPTEPPLALPLWKNRQRHAG